MALYGVMQIEQLPSYFTMVPLLIVESQFQGNLPGILIEWQGDPPDPPPRLS